MNMHDAEPGMLLSLIDDNDYFTNSGWIGRYGIPWLLVSGISDQIRTANPKLFFRDMKLGPKDSQTVIYLGSKTVPCQYKDCSVVVCSALINGVVVNFSEPDWQYIRELK